MAAGWRDRAGRALAVLKVQTPWYWARLKREPPERLLHLPSEPWMGDPDRGQRLTRGEFTFAGQSFPANADIWHPAGAGSAWRDWLHGFGWILDLIAFGGESARNRAREMIGLWLADLGDHWDGQSWRADITGRRLSAWLVHAEWLLAPGGDTLRTPVYRSLGMQARHLIEATAHAPAGLGRLEALRGLAYALTCIPLDDKELARGRQTLDSTLATVLSEDILSDGGHVERSPSRHFAALRLLIDLRNILRAGGGVPDALLLAIDRMAPMLRFFKHGDGGLALFNDSNEEEPVDVRRLLDATETSSKPPSTAPKVGFQRLARGRTIILCDTGVPNNASSAAHAGTLSFEMSYERDRIFVNCGAHVPDESEWRRAQRGTAAHSTLVLADKPSTEILDRNRLGKGVQTVEVAREENENGIWLDVSHDGYAVPYGFQHKRSLYLAGSGDDLRGQDSLAPVGLERKGPAGEAQKFCLRFHLHPRVQAVLIREGTAVLIKTPSGAGWRFRAAGAELALSDSIYLGKRGELRRTQQITLTGMTQPGVTTTLKWALQREALKPVVINEAPASTHPETQEAGVNTGVNAGVSATETAP